MKKGEKGPTEAEEGSDVKGGGRTCPCIGREFYLLA